MSEIETVSLPMPEFAAPRADLDVAPPLPYFLVGIGKLIAMLVLTFGMYQVYWFYQQWSRLQRHGGEDVWPIVRTAFAGLFAYMLFDRVNADADHAGTPTLLGPAPLTLLYFSGILALRLDAPIWIGGPIMLSPLVLAQRVINGLPVVQALPRTARNTRFTVWNWVLLVVVMLLTLLALLPTPEGAAS